MTRLARKQGAKKIVAAGIVLIVFLTGCSQTPAAPQSTEFLGHHLGESPTIWKMIEDPLGPSPSEVCQDIVKTGADAESDRYKDCATFLVSGQYCITTRDWKTYRERSFCFEGWKLALMEEKYLATEYDAVKKDMTARFGSPGKSDSDSVSWQEPDATIRVTRKNDQGATFVVPRQTE